MKREKSRQTIYLVAGLYLVYLAYSMFQSIRGGEVPQDQTALMILFGVLFALLGVGIAAPAASLGTIIQEARSQMVLYPWQMACPLVVLCVMLLCLNAVGSVLEDQTGSVGGNRTRCHWDKNSAEKSRTAGMMTEGRESK